jgi:hypothetical protein
MQIAREPSFCSGNFGIVVRKQEKGHYRAGFVWWCSARVFIWPVSKQFNPASSIASGDYSGGAKLTDWNIYRVEVKDNSIKLKINSVLIIDGIDNQYLSPGHPLC